MDSSVRPKRRYFMRRQYGTESPFGNRRGGGGNCGEPGIFLDGFCPLFSLVISCYVWAQKSTERWPEEMLISQFRTKIAQKRTGGGFTRVGGNWLVSGFAKVENEAARTIAAVANRTYFT